MKLAIHPSIKGKWTPSNGNFPYDGWTNIDASLSDIFQLITEDGYASYYLVTLEDHTTSYLSNYSWLILMKV